MGSSRNNTAPTVAFTNNPVAVRSPSGVHRCRAIAVAVGSIFAGLHSPFTSAANPTEALELPTMEVIGTTLLPGLGTAIRDVPANVQVYTGKDLRTQHQSNIGEYLEQNPTSVTINSS